MNTRHNKTPCLNTTVNAERPFQMQKWLKTSWFFLLIQCRTQVYVSFSNANGEKIKLVNVEGPQRSSEKTTVAQNTSTELTAVHNICLQQLHNTPQTVLYRYVRHAPYMFRPTMANFRELFMNGKNSYGYLYWRCADI